MLMRRVTATVQLPTHVVLVSVLYISAKINSVQRGSWSSVLVRITPSNSVWPYLSS